MRGIPSIPQILKTVLFSNIFIGVVGVGMILDTNTITNHSIPAGFYGFVVFIIITVYAGYGILKAVTGPPEIEAERSNWNEKNRWLLWGELILFGPLAIFLYWNSSIPWPLLIIPVIGTILYAIASISEKIQQRFPFFIKAILLSLVWVYTTHLLPILFTQHRPRLLWIMSLGAWFPIYIICMLFDFRDQFKNYQGLNKFLIYRLSEIFILITLIFFVLVDELAERRFLLARIIVLVFLRITLPLSIKSKSPIWYYAVLDGTMGLPLVYIIQSLGTN